VELSVRAILSSDKETGVVGVPLGQEFLDVTAIFCRTDDIHVQFAVAHFVVEVDWLDVVPVAVTRVRTQLQMPQVEHDLLTLVQ
jgi:hypothetical protein